jgi:hypothetical protein
VIGIAKIAEEVKKHEMETSEIVYGKDHVDIQHADTYYKPKYLRRVTQGKIYAYPNGIPGGWCKHRKIHFVGHSWGA